MSFGAAARKSREPDLPQLLAYAGWLLARREYTSAELLTKFRIRFIVNEELFAAALAKLIALGVQSDRRAAESFISSHAGWGTTRLAFELTRRGLDCDLAAELLPTEDNELARARAVLAGKLRGQPLPIDFAARQKLLAFLAQRGFGFGIIQQAFDLENN